MSTVNPKVDIAFKKIFGVEENKDLLISLINAIVSSEDQVVDLMILNPYNFKNFKNDKLSILDIKAKSLDGKRFNIEIQISDEKNYDKRALYYWAKLYTQQLQGSEDYSSLSKAIGIHILNFTSILDSAKYHNVFSITAQETKLAYFKDLELHTIELNKFINEQENLIDPLVRINNSLDLWGAFLTRHELLRSEQLPLGIDSSSIHRALNVLDLMNFTDEEREAYEDHLKWLMIEANSLKKAEATGVAKAKKEAALLMKNKGLDFNLISEITNLTISEINDLF